MRVCARVRARAHVPRSQPSAAVIGFLLKTSAGAWDLNDDVRSPAKCAGADVGVTATHKRKLAGTPAVLAVSVPSTAAVGSTITSECVVRACVRVFVRVCVCACMYACVRMCVFVRVLNSRAVQTVTARAHSRSQRHLSERGRQPDVSHRDRHCHGDGRSAHHDGLGRHGRHGRHRGRHDQRLGRRRHHDEGVGGDARRVVARRRGRVRCACALSQ